MRPSAVFRTLLVIFLLSLLQKPIFAILKPYIVYLGSHTSDRRHLTADPQTVTNSHHDLLSSVLQSRAEPGDRLIYSYNKIFDGFAAVLHEKEAEEVANHPDVVSVFESQNRQLQTTQSWEFLGIEHNQVIPEEPLWNKTNFGEDIIIANLDSGVWPESKSFTDEGLGPIPRKFKGRCENENDPTFQCNRKLIGARYFFTGFSQSVTRKFNFTPNSTQSPRDEFGHGTHTLSTAGGNFVPGANFHGFANGTAKGGSPKARVVAYKVCWPGGCNDIDILAAFEAAIDDDVDIISASIGSTAQDYFTEGLSIGSFHAVKNGIPVVASAGNDGPMAGTVTNVSPWIITVAASTSDREITSHVILGNKQTFKGASIESKGLPVDTFYPLISGADANNVATVNTNTSLLCKPGTLDPMKVKGKILVCLRGEISLRDKAIQAAQAGAIGMVLANNKENGYTISPINYELPTSQISYRDGLAIFDYIKSTRSPVASLTQAATELGVKPAPVMASFSSRGPNTITPEILKPDITAPGLSILAAYSEDKGAEGGPSPYCLEQGTSMSCPHISSIAALLKKLHRHWSPSAIKSAIVTTASTLDNTEKPIRDSDMTEATTFAYGSGHVSPIQAMDPGLVYDMNHHDYLNFLCALGYNRGKIKTFSKHSYDCPESVSIANFNYPSITIPDFTGTATVTRRLKNVGSPGTYSARIEAPVGVSIIVEPNTLLFSTKNQEIEYRLIFSANADQLPKEYSFGSLVWSDGKHIVRSPIVVKGKV